MIRKIPIALSLYLMRHYFFNFMMLLLGLLAVIYLFDTVELLRRAAKVDDLPLSIILMMGLYKLPEVGQLVFPFAVLFSAMLTFWQLTRRHELVIVRSAGLSVWQFIAPILLVALAIGIAKICLINPLGALLVSRYENLEVEHFNKETSLITLSEQGLWLKQSDENGTAILHSAKIQMPEWVLDKVMVFFFTNENDFLRRIDANSAKLQNGQWNFTKATINVPSTPPEKADFLTLGTDLTINKLENSFSAPETISFWKLPSYIKILEGTGFDSTGLRIHFQNLLSQPLLFMAMILLAGTVSLRTSRMNGGSTLIVLGVFIGFIVFFSSSFLQALGASQQIPIVVAAWFPAIISFLLGLGVLMALEDG